MDRKKYGRRLSFLNAYFSVALTTMVYCIAIPTLYSMHEVSILVMLIGMRTLLNNIWNSWRQIIELRAGLVVEDKRCLHPTLGAKAFREAGFVGVGISVLVAFFSFLFSQEPNPLDSFPYGRLFGQAMVSAGALWGVLWLDRALWEWQALQGKMSYSNWVERVDETAIRVPPTEAGMKRYIRETSWLCGIGSVLIGGASLIPAIALFRSSPVIGVLALFLGSALLVLMAPAWSQVRRNRKACQKAWNKISAPAALLVASVLEEPTPLMQQLRP